MGIRILKKKFSVNALPVCKGDEIRIIRGWFKRNKGKIITVYHKKRIIHVNRVTKVKINGQTVNVGIDPSNCMITKLKMNAERKHLLTKKEHGKKKRNIGTNNY